MIYQDQINIQSSLCLFVLAVTTTTKTKGRCRAVWAAKNKRTHLKMKTLVWSVLNGQAGVMFMEMVLLVNWEMPLINHCSGIIH